MDGEWVVLLEAADVNGAGALSGREVQELFAALDPGPSGSALQCGDRYALQLTAVGRGPVEALSDVIARWEDTVQRLDLPAWSLVRAEVFTPDELMRDLEAAEHGEVGVLLPRPTPPSPPKSSSSQASPRRGQRISSDGEVRDRLRQ